MKIKMLEDYGVTVDCVAWLPKGEQVEVDNEVAVMLLATNRAEPVEARQKRETATADPRKESRGKKGSASE